MIKAKNSPLVEAFFRYYANTNLKRHFHRVVVQGKVDVQDHAVLLLSNHTSWWDGFWALHLNTSILHKRFHFMMDETELKKRWLFSYSGGFSIGGSARSKLESIQYATTLLKQRENMVLIYPQGKLYSSHCRKIQFEKGVDHIQLSDAHPSKAVFLVQLTDYFQFKKPTLYLYVGEANRNVYIGENYEEQYNVFYNECLTQHTQQIV